MRKNMATPISFPKKVAYKIAQKLLSYADADIPVEEVNSYSQEADPFEVGRLDAIASSWFNEADQCLFKDFSIRSTDTVLDVGSGNGGVAHFCGQFCQSLIITDIDANNARNAYVELKKSNCELKSALISDSLPLPIADSSIDKIISMEVIEHVQDPAIFLNELYRVGKTGARYLISAPAGISEQLQQGIAAKEHFLPPNHIQIFNDGELEQLIINTGFTIESVHLDGFYWTIWWLIFWCDGQPLKPPWSELLQSWPMLWSTLMQTTKADTLRNKLNQAMPKTQIIIAIKE